MAENFYESASAEMLNEIIREAESLLDDQLRVAIAADQRAATFSGLLVAAIGAMVGASATLGGKLHIVHVALATLLIAAALCAMWSLRPTPWKFRGNEPFQWANDIRARRMMEASMAEMACHYDDGLGENGDALRSAAMAMNAALILTGFSLVSALCWAWSLVL